MARTSCFQQFEHKSKNQGYKLAPMTTEYYKLPQNKIIELYKGGKFIDEDALSTNPSKNTFHQKYNSLHTKGPFLKHNRGKNK